MLHQHRLKIVLNDNDLFKRWHRLGSGSTPSYKNRTYENKNECWFIHVHGLLNEDRRQYLGSFLLVLSLSWFSRRLRGIFIRVRSIRMTGISMTVIMQQFETLDVSTWEYIWNDDDFWRWRIRFHRLTNVKRGSIVHTDSKDGTEKYDVDISTVVRTSDRFSSLKIGIVLLVSIVQQRNR